MACRQPVIRLWLAFVLLGALTGTATGQSSTTSLLVAEQAASELSRAEGFVPALSAVASDEATLLYPGADIITGRVAIIAFLANQPALEGLVVQWTPLHLEVSGDGTLGVSWGTMSLGERTNGAAGVTNGKYLAAWRRVGDLWRLEAFAPMVPFPGTPVLPAGRAQTDPAAGPSAAADRDFAALGARSGAPVAFEAFAAPDAVTFPGSGLLNRGPVAIRAALEGGPLRTARWEWAPIVAETATSGDLGFTIGRATITVAGPDGDRQAYSKYLSLWRLEGGKGRFLADGGNQRPPGPVQP